MENENLDDGIKLDSAGATGIHKSPFEDLTHYQNEVELDQLLRKKWVIRFYLNLTETDEEWVKKCAGILPEISDEIILKNLGDFNWRTRSTGAFFFFF
ncbi:MAG: hypothetical protein AB8B69_00330 [Chitinophagales bacterium]